LKQKTWKTKSLCCILETFEEMKMYDENFCLLKMSKTIQGEYQGLFYKDTQQEYLNFKKLNNGNFTNFGTNGTSDTKIEALRNW
jgi:hypothetical protein